MMKLIILLSVIVGYSTAEVQGCEDEVSELQMFTDLLGVFHVEKCGDRYTIPTRDEGRLICEKYGGGLASKAEVELVRKNNGYDNCHCGWMTDAVAYPNAENQNPERCGKVNQMNDCPEDPSQWNRAGWNVYCTGKGADELETVVVEHTLSLSEYVAFQGRDCSMEWNSWQTKDVIESGVTVTDCLDYCNDNAECEAFTFNDGHCETFTYVCPKFSDVISTKPDVTMYVKPRHNTGHKNIYTPYLGEACSPIMVTREGETAEPEWGKEQDCAKMCANIPDCTGFNFESREDPSLAYLQPSQEAHLLEYYSHFKAPRGYCNLRNGPAANCESIEQTPLYNYYEKIVL